MGQSPWPWIAELMYKVQSALGASEKAKGASGPMARSHVCCLYMEVEYTSGIPRETRGGGWLDGCYGDRALHFLLDCTP